MMHASAFLLCLLGFAALALGTERQQDALFGQPLPAARTWWARASGWAALAAALAVLVNGQGWGMGLVSLSGHTSLAAGVVLLAFVVHARRGRRR